MARRWLIATETRRGFQPKRGTYCPVALIRCGQTEPEKIKL